MKCKEQLAQFKHIISTGALKTLTGVWHDPQISIFIVVEQLIHVEHRVFLVRDVEPRVHDGRPGQNHSPPLILSAVLRLKHVLHGFADHGVGQVSVTDARRG